MTARSKAQKQGSQVSKNPPDPPPPALPSPTSSAPDRYVIASILVIGLLTVVAHVLGTLKAFISQLWGVHAYAFFPIWVLITAVAVLIVATIVALRLPEPGASVRFPIPTWT